MQNPSSRPLPVSELPNFALSKPQPSLPPPPASYVNFGACLSGTQKEPQECGAGIRAKNLPPIFAAPMPTEPLGSPVKMLGEQSLDPHLAMNGSKGHPKAALDAFFTASKVKLMNQVQKEERRMDMAKFVIEARMGVWDV